MITAFTVWDNRIAPVFDIARHLHIVKVNAGRIVSETQEILADELPVQKVIRLAELGVNALVCGAISRTLHEMVVAYGIQVIPFIAGDLREVIEAWLKDGLDETFAMPGCCRHGRRRGQYETSQERYQMNTRNRGGRGPGGGQGQGRRRMNTPFAEEATDACLCPKCGHREPHERGVPCVQKQCPKCGTAMIRE